MAEGQKSNLGTIISSVAITLFILWLLMKYNNKQPISINQNAVTLLQQSNNGYELLDTDMNIVVSPANKSVGNIYVTINFPSKASNPKANLYDKREVFIYNYSGDVTISGSNIVNVNPSQNGLDLASYDFAKVVYSATDDKWYYINLSNDF